MTKDLTGFLGSKGFGGSVKRAAYFLDELPLVPMGGVVSLGGNILRARGH